MSYLSNSHSRRDRLYIIAEILSIAKDGTLKTQIMYKANLSFTQLNNYLKLLIEFNLMKVNEEDDRNVYRTTAKGCRFLERYKEILKLLNSNENVNVNNNLPIHLLKDLYKQRSS